MLMWSWETPPPKYIMDEAFVMLYWNPEADIFSMLYVFFVSIHANPHKQNVWY